MEKELTLIVTSEGGEAGEGVDYAPTTVAQFGEFVTRLHANNNTQFGVYYRVGPRVYVYVTNTHSITYPYTYTLTPSQGLSSREDEHTTVIAKQHKDFNRFANILVCELTLHQQEYTYTVILSEWCIQLCIAFSWEVVTSSFHTQ